ncbi:MAG TPA: CPBP family intramembrane glutamic endopeptidase [Oligoflexus sp.]|uniref:CPBP family intramembrane glutamic endopeptidase n=1 Tax=Oligoflexus sp. TaxID=1971216 RepID=UPI002D7F53D9|nr:CPBP family intramembrane glutamic endopeptidase [Oligoflexus sp.]HET9238042.1 CPBP family intramembrane glutamic endopeptidase [Oligoflexus sp.]
MDPIATLAYVFLFLTVLALWLPLPWRIPFWWLPLGCSLILGGIAHHLSLAALPPLVVLALATHFLQTGERPGVRAVAAGVLALTGLGLGAHLFPGFHNLKVVDAVQVSEDGIPFTLHLNFDKTLIGVFILGSMPNLIRTWSDGKALILQTSTRAPWIILGLALLSVAFQFVRWDPKVPAILPIWAVTNLLFVCVAEEGFFRGFLQKYLSELGRDLSYGKVLALGIASLLFGVAHFAGGLTYVILASIAGLGYGWMYQVTGRIEASIITHFLLNLVHILLLTYPALAR